MQHIRVSGKSSIAKVAQSIATALRKDGEVEVSAAGKDACYIMLMAIAALDAFGAVPSVKLHIERLNPGTENEFSIVVCDVKKEDEK